MNTNYIVEGDFSLVPESRGIYSWFYPIIIYEEDTYDSFMHRIRYFLNFSLDTMESSMWLTFSKENAWEKYKLNFHIEGGDSDTIKKHWSMIKSDSEFKKSVFESSFWNRPLYVGKAENLNSRINQHQNGVSDFSKRFKLACDNYNFKNDPDFRFSSSLSTRNLLLSYTVLNYDESHLVSLEKILQYTTKPNFSIK
jgi:hypothetical protein